MDILINGLLTAIGTGCLTLVVLIIKWMVKKIRADDLTMKALAHDAYFRQARYLADKETISEEEFENHDYLYRAYHSQGLNGTGDKLHAVILQKPIDPNPSEFYPKLT